MGATVKTYALKFEAEPPQDLPALTDTFYAHFDGLVAESFGRLLIAVYADGHENGVMAAKHTAGELDKHLGIKVIRTDRDLVDASEIARRIGRSRENVRQLIHGERHRGAPFPTPAGAPHGKRIWEWPVVNEWLRTQVPGAGDPEYGLSRDEMTIVDSWILRWRSVPLEQHVTMEFRDIVAPGQVFRTSCGSSPEVAQAWVKSWHTTGQPTSRVPLGTASDS
ncbi:hypothetical protein PJ985_11000 [Streptomyces sp. ACA25]|uniref:hypothetical protein n=1 Tax=Streptomyces sp. ACA25 TaxID=3022596 RepID=UPI0023080117|nr:hypothetical protein [Streptomyces sp. ACA25]MDB1088093.1 hypothetical protein [Streptomyces sp. ACA25]